MPVSEHEGPGIGWNDYLYCLNQDGKAVWRVDVGPSPSKPIVSADNLVIIGNKLGEVVVIDRDGQVKWWLQVSNSKVTKMLLGPNLRVYVQCDDGTIYAIEEAGA